MENPHYTRINRAYRESGREAVPLFQTVQEVAAEIGMDEALQILERCVTEKRMAWLDANLPGFERSGDALQDGYRLFYESYLKITAGEGEVVEVAPGMLVTRWWNPCPTLEACKTLGLETREICRKVYHQPVQAFLERIDSRLRFMRNYEAIRPHTPYCEEIILLADKD